MWYYHNISSLTNAPNIACKDWVIKIMKVNKNIPREQKMAKSELPWFDIHRGKYFVSWRFTWRPHNTQSAEDLDNRTAVICRRIMNTTQDFFFEGLMYWREIPVKEKNRIKFKVKYLSKIKLNIQFGIFWCISCTYHFTYYSPIIPNSWVKHSSLDT